MRLCEDSTYNCWRNMRRRCTDKNRRDYANYGARGISVCERWESFENFLADMGPMPPVHSIERRDVNGNYEPNNCYWLERKLQQRNTTRTEWVTYKGKRMSLAEAIERSGIHPQTIYTRMKEQGMTREQALEAPKRRVITNKATGEKTVMFL